MDMTFDDLNKNYHHCIQMLYNKNSHMPGKVVIKEAIRNAWDSCNAELFARYLLYEVNSDIKTNKDLLEFINYHRNNGVQVTDSISTLFNNLSPIYEKITVGKLMDVCFDKLDVFNRKMISDKFIIAQGIWLTSSEKRDLTEYKNGKMRDRMEVIKERLLLNPDIKLRISSGGLSYNEFRSITQLPTLTRISSLPTIALKTLRDKILLRVENNLEYHINKWTKIKKNIEQVASYKNWILNN